MDALTYAINKKLYGTSTYIPCSGMKAVAIAKAIGGGGGGEPTRDTIKDSWDKIIANVNNGTYSTKYSVGDTKLLDMGEEGEILMQIVAFDADDLADGTGKAATSWVAVELLNTRQSYYDLYQNVQEGGTIWNLLPSSLQSSIVSVSKVTQTAEDGDEILNAKLWFPSAREVLDSSSYEQSGVVYNEIYTDDESRIKSKSTDTTAITWWTRTTRQYQIDEAVRIRVGGGKGNNQKSGDNGVCIGFCI